VLEITLTWVSGYCRSRRGRDNAPFIRSITHAPDQTYIRLRHLHCLFDLAISPPFWIIAWIEAIFMEFRGPKALVNLHGCRQTLPWDYFRVARRPAAWLGLCEHSVCDGAGLSAGRYEGSSSVFSPPDKPIWS